MTKPKTKKLSLRRETVKDLTASELQLVAGGGRWHQPRTYYCTK